MTKLTIPPEVSVEAELLVRKFGHSAMQQVIDRAVSLSKNKAPIADFFELDLLMHAVAGLLIAREDAKPTTDCKVPITTLPPKPASSHAAQGKREA